MGIEAYFEREGEDDVERSGFLLPALSLMTMPGKHRHEPGAILSFFPFLPRLCKASFPQHCDVSKDL